MGNPASFVTSASTADVNTFTQAQTFTGGVTVSGGFDAAGGVELDGGTLIRGSLQVETQDASGTPGNVTINKPSGKVAVAMGASSVVVTNNYVTAASSVFAVLQFVDATATQILSVVPGAGSFTIRVNANATLATKIAFLVIN